MLSMGDLERMSGVSRATVGMIERGLVAYPHPATIRKLADALGVDPRELVKGGDAGVAP